MNKLVKLSLLLFVVTYLFSSCSSDEVYPSLSLSERTIYFSRAGESVTITYETSHVSSIDVSDVPDGFDVSINSSNKTITVTAPTDYLYFDEVADGVDVTFTAVSSDDNYTYSYLRLGTTTLTMDISDQQSNCFVVSEPNTIYSFSAIAAGANGDIAIAPSSVGVVWQTVSTPIFFARLSGDNVEFYVPADTEDYDEDDLEDDLVEGNAIIAAYNDSGDVLWSWHIWISEFDAETENLTMNGSTIMNRNLGALDNSNSSDDEILASYGMYYQWGRKDPFPAPNTFDASNGDDATLCDVFGYSVTIEYLESTSSVGTVSYANAYPATYITGVEDSDYDWLYDSHSTTLWGDTKTDNDPCPKGWRVASPSVFEGLSIPDITEDNLSDWAGIYGWELSDGSTSDLFMGLGRRGQITGKIQNVNTNAIRPEPWVGYYWTTASGSDNLSRSLYFYYDAESLEDTGINSSSENVRSTGMQIRCQRDE